MFKYLLTIPLFIAACDKDESISAYALPDATYVLHELSGAPFTANATISFPEPGKAQGNAPCNRYSATQSVPYPWIKIENIASTKRACPDLAAESAFFNTLESMTSADALGNTLILSNDDGSEMIFKTKN